MKSIVRVLGMIVLAAWVGGCAKNAASDPYGVTRRPIRIDVGFPVQSELPTATSWRLHVLLGPDL